MPCMPMRGLCCAVDARRAHQSARTAGACEVHGLPAAVADPARIHRTSTARPRPVQRGIGSHAALSLLAHDTCAIHLTPVHVDSVWAPCRIKQRPCLKLTGRAEYLMTRTSVWNQDFAPGANTRKAAQILEAKKPYDPFPAIKQAQTLPDGDDSPEPQQLPRLSTTPVPQQSWP